MVSGERNKQRSKGLGEVHVRSPDRKRVPLGPYRKARPQRLPRSKFPIISLPLRFVVISIGGCSYFMFCLPHYPFETLATPHSRQRAFSSDVITPQDGHIVCDRKRVICGFSLRLQWINGIRNSTISRPTGILVAFMERPSLQWCRRPSQFCSSGAINREVDQLRARSLQNRMDRPAAA